VDLRQLRLFIAVAEEGSIRAGARRLMMAQPAASQALRKLEREARCELLGRSSRGIELSEAGIAFLEHARDIVARVDSAFDSARSIAGARRHSLRVGLMAGIISAGNLTGPIISAFRRRHPEVVLEIVELSFDMQFEALASGEVDVGIVRDPYPDDAIVVEPLFAEPRLLCCSSAHPVATADSLSIGDILDYPMIDMVRTPEHFRAFWQLNDARGGPPSHPYADPSVSLLEIQLSLLSEPVLMPVASSAWGLYLDSPLLRAIRLVDVEPTNAAVAYVRECPDAYVQTFARCAREVCEQAIGLVPGGQLT
jgi:DNA-binding transcriptional LysR family regulator